MTDKEINLEEEGGVFNNSLTNLLGAIPKDKGTSLDEDPLEEQEEEQEEGNEDEEQEQEEQEEQEEGNEDEDEDEEGSPIIDALAEEFGDVDFGDEQEFDNEIDASKVYVRKLLESKTKEIGTNAIKGLFEDFPEAKALIEHLSSGFGLNSFLKESQPENYTPVELEEATEDVKISIIRKAYKLRGLDEEEIEDNIEAAKDSGKLDARAETAQNYLKKKHEEEVERIKKEEKQEQEKNQKKAEESLKEINKVLESGKLVDGKVSIDKTKAKTLQDFISNPKQRNEAWSKLSTDKLLFIDLLIATDFKDLKFGESKTKANLSKNIKIKNTKTTRVNMNSNKGGSNQPFDVKNFLQNVNN